MAALSLTSRLLRASVQSYRLLLRPLLPPACRFQPSCSAYAVQALETLPPLRALLLITRRILSCHPWHPGGCDPVPPR